MALPHIFGDPLGVPARRSPSRLLRRAPRRVAAGTQGRPSPAAGGGLRPCPAQVGSSAHSARESCRAGGARWRRGGATTPSALASPACHVCRGALFIYSLDSGRGARAEPGGKLDNGWTAGDRRRRRRCQRRRRLYHHWQRRGIFAAYQRCASGGSGGTILISPRAPRTPAWPRFFR